MGVQQLFSAAHDRARRLVAHRRSRPVAHVPQPDALPAETGFDNFVRSLGSQASRRAVLKVTLLGAVSLLTGLGTKKAWAAARCLCGTTLYDPDLQCCTPSGVQPKHPIADLAACPQRTFRPDYTCVPNGCGAEGGDQYPPSFGAASFLECCNGHDCCWGTCRRDRTNCDRDFLACLQTSCDSAYPPLIRVILGVEVDVNRVKRASCRAAAQAYFAGVETDRWGTPAYIAAQQDACDCCGPQPCLTCPGGTCLSLPSCGDPGCVCFSTVEGNGFCHLPQACEGLPSCASSANCPDGWACVSVTCCGGGAICIRPCFVVGGAAVSPFSQPTGGRMTAGNR